MLAMASRYSAIFITLKNAIPGSLPLPLRSRHGYRALSTRRRFHRPIFMMLAAFGWPAEILKMYRFTSTAILSITIISFSPRRDIFKDRARAGTGEFSTITISHASRHASTMPAPFLVFKHRFIKLHFILFASPAPQFPFNFQMSKLPNVVAKWVTLIAYSITLPFPHAHAQPETASRLHIN